MAVEDAASADQPRPSGNAESQQWAIQRRIDDVFAKLGEKFGNLTGRVVVQMKPETTFAQIGGLREAKSIVRSFGTALTDPELYRNWGITPPKGVLLYGPPGTGKTLLARALATETAAVFYHLKLMNLTSKFGPNTGEVLQEILAVAKEQGRGVVFLDEANALSLEHLLPPAQAREASARLVAALCEKLDGLEDFSRMVVVGSTSRTDSVDSSLVAALVCASLLIGRRASAAVAALRRAQHPVLRALQGRPAGRRLRRRAAGEPGQGVHRSTDRPRRRR